MSEKMGPEKKGTEKTEVRFGGYGGQGIVLMGGLLGQAAVLDGLWAAGSNSYGAQARGSACKSEVVLSVSPVDYPHVMAADCLVAMSQGAYEKFLSDLKPDGLVVMDDPHVRASENAVHRSAAVPATNLAVKELNSKQVANVLMLSAVTALTGAVSREALIRAIRENVPERFIEINLKAVEIGFRAAERSDIKI